MGGDTHGVNAEYAWRDHSWYAILSFFFFLPSPLVSYHSHPLSSVPSFPLPHLLCLANFNPLPCSSSPASRFVEMHGKCTARYLSGVPHVRDMCDEPTQALRARHSLKWINLGATFAFWYATLVSSSSPSFSLLSPS